MNAAYIIDAIRTPIGSFTGTLAPVRADDLAARVLRELVKRHPSLDPAAIDDVILGCATWRAWRCCSRACPSPCQAKR